jgi:hypothetical protein
MDARNEGTALKNLYADGYGSEIHVAHILLVFFVSVKSSMPRMCFSCVTLEETVISLVKET